MAENKGIKKEKNQPSNVRSTEPKAKDGSSLIKRLTWARTNYGVITAIVIPCIAGIFAFWEGFGQWWFGFDLPLWIYFVLPASLLVIWVVAFCGYYREAHPEQKIVCGYYGEAYPERMPALKKEEQEEKVKLRCLSLNVFVMIAIPVLLLGILGGYFAMDWRLTEKIVILVEPFEGDEKDPYYLARAVKSGIESSIRLSDRNRVKVVLGKQYEKASSKEMSLYEHALKYRADMVISGWHTERDSEIRVTVNFYVVRVPQSLPAIFRRREGDYPQTLLFRKEEIENFSVHFTLRSLLEYESILMIGAGAYASGEWETAEHYFRKALKILEQKQVYSEELIEGDKALLTLYIGNCLSNQGQLNMAIEQFHRAVSLGSYISPADIRYHHILSNAFLNRGIAYREKNKFELAASDFKKAGLYSRLTDGVQRRHLDEPRIYSRQIMQTTAVNYYDRGEQYLKNRDYVYARAELETAVEMYRKLYKEAIDPNRQMNEGIQLGRSLFGLGHLHNRLALPELKDDKNTKQAILYLKEAHDITIDLEGIGVSDFNKSVLELRADCFRHLGEAHRAQDQSTEVEKAKDYHQEAISIWQELEKGSKTEKEQVRIASKIVEEQTRIGNVYRRLNDLDPRKEWREKAIEEYEKAIKMWVGKDKYEILFLDSFGSQYDVNEATKALLAEVVENITAHHLASSLLNLADAHINRADPNEQDIEVSCKLLKFATECYDVAHKKLDIKKDREWIVKVRDEEKNFSVKDDLAWCLTLYGYALTRQGLKEPNHNEIYNRANIILKKAKKYHEQLRDKNYSNLVLNLFALSLTEYKLGGQRHRLKAIETFREACLKLRNLTRSEKKVWYLDHVCTIMDKLEESRFQVAEEREVDEENFKNLKTWLKADTVREGRRALDKIIEGVNNRLKKSGEVDG